MAKVTLIIGQRLDIELEESGNASLGFDVKDGTGQNYNFSGCQFQLVAKTARNESLPDLFKLLSYGTAPGILLTSGNITVVFPSTENKSGKYVYDCWKIKDGLRKTWFWGDLTIRPRAY